METLEQLLINAKEVKQVRQSLISSLSNAEDELKKILKDADLMDRETLKKFDFNSFGWRLFSSNAASYYRITKIGTGAMIEYSGYSRGSELYYHGDFNANYRVMTRQETLDLANCLKDWIENMNKVMEEMIKEESIEV